MRKLAVITVLFASMAMLCSVVYANPPCPQRADRLEDFAVCMRPFANGRGQVLAGYAEGAMDYHTAALMNSMHRSVSSPQVMPTIPMAASFASNMAVAITATHRWGWGPGAYWWFAFPGAMPYYPYYH